MDVPFHDHIWKIAIAFDEATVVFMTAAGDVNIV